jgi:hypothetical protein
MKKFTFVLMTLLAFTFSVKAQQYVSTEPANRNVILEEFTGRGCGYCTDGHRIANQIMANNPGRVWAVNVHAGGYALTSYPNFNIPASSAIMNGFNVSSFPSGVVNRTTGSAIDRGQWNGQTNTQLNQASECNVAGVVSISPDTRMANITVEVYYTGNSSVGENYLTIAMLQDSILGSQSDYGNYNPTQWLNGQYVHMHVLRDVITPTWGEAISPTTAGTLITKTYEYQIPETIGSPNGVEVKLDHIFFLAWITERYQGTPTRPIMTACELEKTTMTNDPIHPIVTAFTQKVEASCSQTKTFTFNVANAGLNDIDVFKYTVELEGVTQEFEWSGKIPSGGTMEIEFEIDVPFGNHSGMLSFVEVNGEPYEYHLQFSAESLEWVEDVVEGDLTTLKVYIIQDQLGEQTTWNIINSNGDIIAEGGPYQHLIGSGATQPNVETLNNIPVNDCYMFTIFDSQGNGICCNYGNGTYYVKDVNGNKIFEGDGDFGEEAKHMFSLKNNQQQIVTTEEPRVLGPNEAMFIGSINGQVDAVGFEYYKLIDHIVVSVEGVQNGNVFTATVDDLDANTMYSVRAFAMVGNDKVTGSEIHFHTLTEGVSELESTLKVYPNPANDYLIVEGEMTSVEVYNTVGQCLLTKQVDGDTQIDLAGFNNGIYFLRVYNNGETTVRKFSVNR